MQNRIITLPAFTLMFPNLYQPKAIVPGSVPKYTATAMIAPMADITQDLMKTIEAVMFDKFGELAGRTPLHFNSADDKYGFPYYVRLNMSTKSRPLLREALPDSYVYVAGPKTFYSGCLCTAEMEFFAYDSHGCKGVGAHLLSVTKLADQELTEEQAAALAEPEPFNGL